MTSPLRTRNRRLPLRFFLAGVLGLAFLVPEIPGAGETVIVRGVTGEGACAVSGMSAEQSQLIALQKARSSAIEQAAGVRVVSSTLVKDGAVAVDLIRTYSRGFIVSEKAAWLPLAQYQESPDRPPIPEYRVRIAADVAIPARSKAQLGLSAALDNRVYRRGERARLELAAERVARVAVFNFTADDKVVLLLPNGFDKANLVSPGNPLCFPAEGSKITLSMQTLPGHARDAEAFFVIAVAADAEVDFLKHFGGSSPKRLTEFFELYAEIASNAEEIILPYAVEGNE